MLKAGKVAMPTSEDDVSEKESESQDLFSDLTDEYVNIAICDDSIFIGETLYSVAHIFARLVFVRPSVL